MDPTPHLLPPHQVTVFDVASGEVQGRVVDFLRRAGLGRGEVLSSPESFRSIPFGISNTTVLAIGVLDGRDGIVRIFDREAPLLGVDRAAEQQATRHAAALGLTPKIIWAAPDGILSERAIGRHIPHAALLEDGVIQEAFLSAIRRLHQSEAKLKTFNPRELIREYVRLAERLKVTFDSRFATAWKHYERAADQLERVSAMLVPCHNDLSGSNVLWSDANGIELLDWEYSGLNDPLYDIAKFTVHHSLDREIAQELLLRFDPALRSDQVAQFHAQRIVAAMWQVCWLYVQSEVSEVHFDFRAEAARRLEQFLNLVHAEAR